MTAAARSSGPRRAAAFAMIEVVVALLLVTVMFVAALNTVGAARGGQAWNADRLRGLQLASALMGEIQDQYYADPSGTSTKIGIESAENQAVRTTLNDVDDYHGLSESPPRNRDGTAMAGLSTWRRTVAISWVRPDRQNITSLSDTGVKRITVTVFRGNVKVAELVALRSAAIPR